MSPLSISKILLPMDFSGRCLGAAHYAIFLAARFHSEITIVHVLPAFGEEPVPDFGGVFLSRMLDARRADAQRQLDQLSCPGLEADAAHRLLLEGDPAETIVDVAHSGRFDLIILATHGRGLFRRLLLGSVSSKVLHDADCPVWTGIHMETAGVRSPISIRRVLCATSLSPHGTRIAQWAGGIAAAFGAELHMIHVIPTIEAAKEAEHLRQHVDDAARARMEAFRQSCGIEAGLVLETGEIPKTVSGAAKRLESDLLVIGRSPETGTLGRLRANAYAIIRESPCPVVSV